MTALGGGLNSVKSSKSSMLGGGSNSVKSAKSLGVSKTSFPSLISLLNVSQMFIAISEEGKKKHLDQHGSSFGLRELPRSEMQ